jgi:hypothetical protein
MSSASHGPTQADDLFQEQCGTPIAAKFLELLSWFDKPTASVRLQR